ncbi:MAG: methylated-DNA--[protein]-cysteine S-methyltransferase [Labedaea sp.]
MSATKKTMTTPVGSLLLTGEETEAGLLLDSVSFADPVHSGHDAGASAAFADVERQLAAYFAGELERFCYAHTNRGTEFQRRVWAMVDTIPYGATISYAELAGRAGAPRDRIRAVAAAVGANPLLVLRPCHRVIGSNKSLTGYAGGVPRKQFLLVHEGAPQPQLMSP